MAASSKSPGENLGPAAARMPTGTSPRPVGVDARATSDPAAMTMGDAYRQTRFRMLVRQTPIHLLISFTLSSLLAAALWQVAPMGRLLAFLAAIHGSVLVRLSLYLLFRRRPALLRSEDRWELVFAVSILFAGACWGFGTWIVLPAEPAHRALVAAIVVGMTAGASYYTTSRTSLMLLTLASIALPVTLSLLLAGDALEDRVLALGALILLLAAMRFVLQSGAVATRMQKLSRQLEEARKVTEHLARTDGLTGLLNRRCFYETCQQLALAAAGEGRPCAVVLVDLDHFKRINDRHGHAAGDDAIVHFSRCLTGALDETDVAGRLGGEEFAVFLAGGTAKDARARAQAIRDALAAAPFCWQGSELSLTASLGVAELDPRRGTLDSLLSEADLAMYAAKRAGRDQIAVAAR